VDDTPGRRSPASLAAVRVLIVEDDAKLASALQRGFEAEGIAVDIAARGEDALWRAESAAYGTIVLDVMLPGIDGIETCRRLRGGEVWAPIIMLTARDAVADRVAGLNSGADDYLIKPFSFEELLARVRALDRRGATARPAVLTVGELQLDPVTHQARRGSAEIELSAREVAILEAFMRRPGEVLSRYELLELVWSGEFDHRSNVVEVAVRRLREKIDRPFHVESLQTVRGAGYRLCDPAS
jgi:two-component system OmpR family response regulator